jgi:hypothetical protein
MSLPRAVDARWRLGIPLKKRSGETLQLFAAGLPKKTELRERGRELGYSKYTTEHIGEELLELYQSLLKNF